MLKRFFSIDTTDSALFILKQIAYSESKKSSTPIPIEQQVFFLFVNRMLIDAQSMIALSKKGLYGTSYSIAAMMLRSSTMYASLVSDKTKLDSFWNEEADTYQTNPTFKKDFMETAISKAAKNKFGGNSFDRNEFEKLLHGSCFAIRKYYSKREIDDQGKFYPVLTLGKHHDKRKEKMIKFIVGGIILDFLGVFFTDYQDKKRNDYSRELSYYYGVIKKVQEETKKQEKELTKQGR
jgi:hypothetical protein